ncbi:hypothetical protein [Pedobacter sp. Hv1]|uniref:hypothetical protein n=1 Tax=Pedobacter sp. Hv1 TaxID=1740090 RepID=UPI0006D8C0EC|nr:hypothetical protein [Pedobacter sp. Hv1]KQB99945.1 hypothetical protein AQF98_15670 [Pedobacter sp. Hv1]
MFLPLIIAILLGLVNPANYNTNCNSGSTVYVNANGTNSGDDPNDPGDGGDGGDEGGGNEDGPGHGGPGGNTGQNPPIKPPTP